MAKQIESKQVIVDETVTEVRVPEATLELRTTEPVVAHLQAAPPPIPIPVPIPIPLLVGSRVMIWKQDPTVAALGRRLAFLPGLIANGPQDTRAETSLPGTTPVVRNVNGDFIFPTFSAESDCVHTYSVVVMALRMWQQSLAGQAIPWAWNTGGNTQRITVKPRGFNGANAFYSRSGRELSFGFFTPQGSPGQVFTCRSLDITAHEAGHAILDGLRPGWLGVGNVPQTGGLHESFGDLTAVFLALAQFDQVEAFIALSKGNLHDANFLAAVAEEFGAALGRPAGLRNADNDLKLSQVANQVHALSQIFTGAIYDILADIFVHERIKQAGKKDLAQILFEVAQHLRRLLLQAILAAPASGATFADVANEMIKKSKAQGDPLIYRTFIKNRFTVREVVVTATPLAEVVRAIGVTDYGDSASASPDGDDTELQATNHISLVEGVPQDRAGTCGTMQLPEYARPQRVLSAELKQLATGAEIDSDEAVLATDVKELQKAFA